MTKLFFCVKTSPRFQFLKKFPQWHLRLFPCQFRYGDFYSGVFFVNGNIMVKMRDAFPVIILQYMGVLKAVLNELCCTGEDIVTIPAHILFKKVIIDQYRSFDMHPL